MMRIRLRFKMFKIFTETLLLVIILLLIKIFLNLYGFEYIEPSTLMTSIMAGCFFVLGFILTSTHVDYKESERLPDDLSTAVEGIYQDGKIYKEKYKRFNFDELRTTLSDILILFRKDLDNHTQKSYFKAHELSVIFAKLEKFSVPPNYIVKLKQDQSIIMRVALRINYIQKIQPIPSAFILVESIVVGLSIILLFTKMDSLVSELVALGFISFIFIYMLKLIKILEKPFHHRGTTMDDVSIFHLEEQQKRIKNSK